MYVWILDVKYAKIIEERNNEATPIPIVSFKRFIMILVHPCDIGGGLGFRAGFYRWSDTS